MIPTPERTAATTGSPEDHVRHLTDLQLQDVELVSDLRRGLGWDPEPERYKRAAAFELQWRKENKVSFGWVKTR